MHSWGGRWIEKPESPRFNDEPKEEVKKPRPWTIADMFKGKN